MIDAIKYWSADNSALGKCTRTIAHGVIGVLIAYAADIVSGFGLDATSQTVIVAMVMAVLSPIQAAIGRAGIDGGEDA